MTMLPPIDLHAHLDTGIAASDLTKLAALVFAATRSLEEAEQALARTDAWTIWGVGCHPGRARAQKAFDRHRFTDLIRSTAYVSEIGLDGTSRVPPATQKTTFAAVLDSLQRHPRIASIHSVSAAGEVLDCLAAQPIQGVVLHWWLGNALQTARALELGCYFSVNSHMLQRQDLLERLPLERVLTETDHPFGDRANGRAHRPGRVDDVERQLATMHGVKQVDIRGRVWTNLADIVSATKCGPLLPDVVRRRLTTT